MTVEQLNFQFKFPKVPLILIDDENSSMLLSVDTKIVLFHAQWSMSSVINIKAIFDKLTGLKINVPVFFVDIDTVGRHLIKDILGRISHGNGEAVYIDTGMIKARHTNEIHGFLEELENYFGNNT